MPGFTKGPGFKTPFGKNVPYRSTKGILDESYTFARDALPFVTIDGEPTRVLQPGMVLAKITSGANDGKVGPFQGAAGTVEVQTLTEGVAITAGTYVVNVFGVDTAAIAFDADLATFQAALRAAAIQAADPNLADIGDEIVVTGGPVATTPWTVTFNGSAAINVPEMTVDLTGLTGTITVATATPGAGGATDGRELTANIVGVNKTFLPTQLLHRDVEVAAMHTGSFVQVRCLELDADGLAIPLTNTTADAMRSTKTLDCLFF